MNALRITVEFSPDDERAILWSCCLDDEERDGARRGICREYLENKLRDMLRSLREEARADGAL